MSVMRRVTQRVLKGITEGVPNSGSGEGKGYLQEVVMSAEPKGDYSLLFLHGSYNEAFSKHMK